jgi:peptidoglycan hydrolase-like protein with peptidoglycan-binding domain
MIEWRDDESNGARIARCCEEALALGPMGERQRSADYRAFVSCGLEPDGGRRLASIRTSCAIFARAVHHWSGRPAHYPWHSGQGMFHGWLGDLDLRHPAWVDARHATPEPGDLFYIEKPSTNNNHVGFFVADRGRDVWRTAEGGGGDGTRCALAVRILGDRFDHYGRTLRGWWSAARLDLTHRPAPYDPIVTTDYPTLRAGDFGPAVRTLQAALRAAVDGVFGPHTESALRAFQSAEGIVADGICGPRTWAAIRGEL